MIACMYGRILSTSTMERGYSQLIYFAGYGGNHNETPNFAYFDGWPGTQYDDQTNTTVIREGTSARDCHASYDANGGEQAAAMVGVINILEDNEQFERTLNTNMRMSSFNGSDANLLGGFETGGVSDFIYEECMYWLGAKSGAPSPVTHKAGFVTRTLLFGSATMLPVHLSASISCSTWLCLCCAGSSLM